MRIKKLKIQNFLSFGTEPQEFSFSSENLIVGPNSAGKTNVFRAIEVVGGIFQDSSRLPEIYYHNFDYKNPFEIEIEIEFTDHEVCALTNYLVCSCLHETVNVGPGENQEAAHKLMKNLITGYGNRYFSEFCKNISIIVRSEGQTIYRPELFLRMCANGKDLYYFSYSLTKKMSHRGSYSVHNVPRLLLNELKLKFPELLSNYLKEGNQPLPDLDRFREIPTSMFDFIYEKLTDDGSDKVDFSGFRLDEFESRYQQDFPEIFELRDFVKERGGKNTEGANFVSLIGLIFNNSIVKIADIRSKPKSTLSSLKTEDSSGITNIDGSNMASTLFSLRNSENPHEKTRYNQILAVFKDLTGSHFDVILRETSMPIKEEELVFLPQKREILEADETRILGIRKSTKEATQYEILIQIIKNDIPIPIEFSAAGVFETLIILTSLIGYKNKIILLDEPALNLHPTSQKRILQLINEAVYENNNQVITITHSPFMINSEKINHIWKISQTSTGSQIMNLGNMLQTMSSEDNAKIIKNFRNSDIRSILFQRGVVFVEGPTDKIVIEKIDHFLSEQKENGANLEENEWAIIEMGGKKSAISFIRLALKLEIPYIAVFDHDALMHCEAKIVKNNHEVRTSIIPFIIDQTKGLTQQNVDDLILLERELEEIETKKQNGLNPQKQFWYPSSKLSKLKTISESNSIFVFTKDIEGIMQSHVTKKESKPLQAIEKINELILNDSIPEEFYLLVEVLKTKLRTKISK